MTRTNTPLYRVISTNTDKEKEYHWVHIVTEAAATAGMKQKIDEATQVIGWVPTPLNYQGTGFG